VVKPADVSADEVITEVVWVFDPVVGVGTPLVITEEVTAFVVNPADVTADEVTALVVLPAALPEVIAEEVTDFVVKAEDVMALVVLPAALPEVIAEEVKALVVNPAEVILEEVNALVVNPAEVILDEVTCKPVVTGLLITFLHTSELVGQFTTPLDKNGTATSPPFTGQVNQYPLI